MSLFFTADTHFCDDFALSFGHIKRDGRPFKDVNQMDRTMIRNFNKKAKKNDIIYCIGDFLNYNSFDLNSWKRGIKVVKKIKAKVVLIFGNQETRIMKEKFNDNYEKFKQFLLDAGFYEVYEKGLELECVDNDKQNVKLYLNHYPSLTRKECFNLFGHIHNRCYVKRYGINVGVDCNYFNLMSLKDVMNLKECIEKYMDEEVFY